MNMSDEARAARNAYLRAWRRKNPDKVAAAKSRYWEKKVMQFQIEQTGQEAQNEQRQ